AKTDDYSRKQYYRPQDFALVDKLTQIANNRGINNAQAALAWVLQQPGVTAPIIGATKPHHLDDALAALNVRLDESELKLLDEAYQPRAVIGHS
ncbi:MAG TPA: aldo/keto reductase, partial [Bryobacteraceae bacterium]|nr:aldo/keto reductase [Bryobacteraceae bacterium]